MIPVGVEQSERSEIDPATDSCRAISPAGATRLIGGVAEPKRTLIKRCKAALSPKNAAGLAFPFAVVSPYRIDGVLRKLFE